MNKLPPEQQKAFDMVVKQAMSFLIADDNAKTIIGKAQSGDPKQAVVDAMTPVLKAIWQAAQKSGADIEAPVFLAAGIRILTLLAEMLAAVGIISEQEIPQFAAQTAKLAVDQHNAAVQQNKPQEPQPQGLAATAGGAQ